jgi:deoxyadenosine/deoxycytidine kinase
MKKFVTVAGNIGVGKSTLVEMICKKLSWTPFFEPVAENPYLADFYKDMQAWAFQSQIFFLTHRLRAHHQLALYPASAVQDRSVYEDAEIFAHNLFLQGHIRPRDYQTYRELYQTLVEFLPPPDLVIYLNNLYETWIADFTLCPVLTVPADDIDYVAHNGHLELIAQKVEERLTGKEEVIFDPEEVARAALD